MKPRIILLTFGLVVAASIGLPSYASDAKVAAKFDANRLRTGTFVYQNLMGEKDIGKSENSIRKTPGASTFDFSNVVTGEFSQRWTAITKENLQPTSAKLSSGQGRSTPVFDLKYASDRVTGFSVRKGSRRLVDDKIPLAVVDQRVDWAAVTASDLKPGRNFEFEVYDPNIGVSHVIVRVAAAASVKVPAGQFEVYPATYQIGKRTGVEQYRVLVTIQKPRMLVREEFPDGTTTDLVSGPINSVAFVAIKMGRTQNREGSRPRDPLFLRLTTDPIQR